MEQFERVPEKHRLRGDVSKRNVPRGHIGPAEGAASGLHENDRESTYKRAA